MSDLPELNFKPSQISPGTAKCRLNTCLNPDCICFGKEFKTKTERQQAWKERFPNTPDEKMDIAGRHGPGGYKLSGTDK